MSLTNQQRTRLINAATGADARVLGISQALLNQLDIRQYIPPSVDKLLHEHVSSYYLFKANTTGEDGKTKDGLTTWIDDKQGRLYCIGIGTAALDKGPDYVLLVLLHELAHVLIDKDRPGNHEEHDEAFHAMLDQLILAVNDFSGKNLKNDYYGL